MSVLIFVTTRGLVEQILAQRVLLLTVSVVDCAGAVGHGADGVDAMA
jgi:hypothetical protein